MSDVRALHAERAAALVRIFYERTFAGDPPLIQPVRQALKAYGENHPEVSLDDLTSMAQACCQLYPVFGERDASRAANLLNDILRLNGGPPRRTSHDNSAWHLHSDAPWGQWLLASSALALAVLMAERQKNAAGRCQAAGCGRPVIDSGRGPGRRFGSSRCATRVRVAAYRQRQHRGP